jgi:hypothetical protein
MMRFAKFVIAGVLPAMVTFGAPALASADPPGHTTLTLHSPVSVGRNGDSQFFTILGRGFDPSTTGTLTVQASWGEFVWGSAAVNTNAQGDFTLPLQYWTLGTPCDFTATFTYTDSFGLQASATQVVNGC